MAKVRAKSLGWDESLTPESLLELEPFSGPFDLEGELEIWEAADRTVYVVGGYEADPDTIEDIENMEESNKTELTVSERARISLKAQLAGRVNTELAGRGNPEALISYWREGEGAERINWGTACDFTRCMLLVGKYLPDSAGGFCQNRHMEIYGESNAARDKRLDRNDDCSGVTRPE